MSSDAEYMREALSLARMKGEGRLRIAVTDGQIPGNNGAFEVRFAPGAANEVRKTDAAPDVALTIQDFSRLLVGAAEFDPEWQPNVRLRGDPETACRVFYRKPCYVVERF